MGNEKEFIKEIGQSIRDILDEGGITREYLRDKLCEELDATITKTFQHQGVIVDSEEKIAWDVRQRARQDAHKLRGDYPAEEHRITGEIGPAGADREELLAISRKIYEEVRKKKREK